MPKEVAVQLHEYMADAFNQYNLRCDWLSVRALLIFFRNAYGPITNSLKQLLAVFLKPYNKRLIKLERSVLAGNSQTLALLY